MKLSHPYCQDSDCRICLEEHLALGRKLDELTGDDTVDHLGKYHKFVSDSGHEAETKWGWATPLSFNDELIQEYVDWYKGEIDPEYEAMRADLIPESPK